MVNLAILDKIGAIVRLRVTLASRGLLRGPGVSNLISTVVICLAGSAVSIGMAVLFAILIQASVVSGDLKTLHFNLKVAFYAFFIIGIVLPIIFQHLQIGIDATRFRLYPISRAWLYAITVGSGFGSPEHLLYYPSLAAIYVTGVLPAGGGAAIGTAVILLLLIFYVALGGTIALVMQRIMRNRKTREILTVLGFFVLTVMWFAHFLYKRGWVRQFEPITRVINYLRSIPAVDGYLPPAIAADAIVSLHNGHILSALHGILHLLLWIAGVTAIGYLVFSKLHFEESGGKRKVVHAATSEGTSARTTRSAVFDLAGLTPLPAETCAVFAKELLYIKRSAMGRSMILLVPCITVVHSLMIREAMKGSFMGIRPGELGLFVISIYIAIVIGNYIFNSFQWEGEGIQAYFLSPASLVSIIAGKNMGIFVYSTLLFCVSTVMWKIIANELNPLILANGFLIFANSILTIVIVGNFLAVKYPVPCDASRIRRPVSQTAQLVMFLIILVIIVYLAAVMIVPAVLGVSALKLPFLIILLVLQAAVYRITLRSAGSRMNNGREILLNRLLVTSYEIR